MPESDPVVIDLTNDDPIAGPSTAAPAARAAPLAPNRVECSICMEAVHIVRPHDIIQVVPCNHVFHTRCCTQWFRSHRSCPNCRGEATRLFHPFVMPAPAGLTRVMAFASRGPTVVVLDGIGVFGPFKNVTHECTWGDNHHSVVLMNTTIGTQVVFNESGSGKVVRYAFMGQGTPEHIAAFPIDAAFVKQHGERPTPLSALLRV